LLTIDKTGKLLLPAEGEGRNAIFAAKAGWEVTAIDSSAVGREKALKFAEDEGVEIEYEILDLQNFEARPDQYDFIAIIFGHFPSDFRQNLHQKFVKSLKAGGHILIEAFAKEQINNTSGGPQDVDMLYSLPLLEEDFSGLSIKKLSHKKVFLNEGKHHGWADVVRFIGIKA
jgi:cyclopropane fatty-acyl-phospholipid synthase-like methyltransferase